MIIMKLQNGIFVDYDLNEWLYVIKKPFSRMML